MRRRSNLTCTFLLACGTTGVLCEFAMDGNGTASMDRAHLASSCGGLVLAPPHAVGTTDARFQITTADAHEPLQIRGVDRYVLSRLSDLRGRPRWGLRVLGTAAAVGDVAFTVRQGDASVDGVVEWRFAPVRTDGRSPYFVLQGAVGDDVVGSQELAVPEPAAVSAHIVPGDDGAARTEAWSCEVAGSAKAPGTLAVTVRGVVAAAGDQRLVLELQYRGHTAQVPILVLGR